MATPSVRCPQCGTTYPVAADLLGKGKRGRCKQCQTVFPLDPALVPPTQPAPAPASTAADSLGPGLLADVAIEKELGRGGMGKVYLVRRASDGQRFALKRVLVRGEPARRQFLTELRTWIDLPTHPHLAACRFFRTAGEEVAIFAEYVAGGSLDAWLTAGRMPGLAERLDVAIQTAWGLHAAHEWGVIHQDVKPANVLLAEEPNPPGPPSLRGKGGEQLGVMGETAPPPPSELPPSLAGKGGGGVRSPSPLAKVADFGLARAQGLTADGGGGSADVQVTGRAGTPAYQAPEQAEIAALQAAGAPPAQWPRVTRQTDAWSWGLTVLALFCGGRRWNYGQAAAQVLDQLTAPAAAEESRPPLPAGVVAVLRRCFQRAPAQRWPTLLAAAEALQEVYAREVGQPYPRPVPAFPRRSDRPAAAADRRTADGYNWDSPEYWLERVCRTAGRQVPLVLASLPPRDGSRKAQGIADLAGYEEVRRLLERWIAEGQSNLESVLAAFYKDAGELHIHLDDSSGALSCYSQAISIYERLVEKEGRIEFANDLAGALVIKGVALADLGQFGAAALTYDRAIAIRTRIVEQEDRDESANQLANAINNKGNLLQRQGLLRAAVAAFENAIAISLRLGAEEGRVELASELASAINNKGIALLDLGELGSAVESFGRATSIYERLVEHEGRTELVQNLASTLNNMAVALTDQFQPNIAAGVFDRAIIIYQQLVHEEGRTELTSHLARAIMNKATTLSELGQSGAAITGFNQAIVLFQRLVEHDGRSEMAPYLAMAFFNMALISDRLGNLAAALDGYTRAAAWRERLLTQQGREELAGDWAQCLAYKADMLRKVGRHDEAQQDARRAVAILQAEVARNERADLRNVLQWALRNLGDLL